MELFGAVVLLGVLGGIGTVVVMAIGAWVRVGNLERRLAALEARSAPAPASAAAATAVPESAMPAAPAVPPETALVFPSAPSAASPAASVSASQTHSAAPTGPVPEQSPGAAAPRAHPSEAIDWERRIAGRWLNRVGLTAVAIGMSYFLKYAIDNDWVGPTGQVAIGFLVGTLLVASGPWWLARGYRYFADGLTGLGAAILYMSAWAAASYYQLIPLGAGFAVMIAITAAVLAIAVARHSRWIAIVALLGGFLTPVLVATGRNAPIELFGYLAVLNAGLLVVARVRAWHLLHLPAFALTQLYFWVWFGRFYQPDAMFTTTAFAVVFFAEFALLPIVRRVDEGRLAPIEVVLALASPTMLLLAWQQVFWPDHRWGLTIATLGLAAVYLVLARLAPSGSGTPSHARLLFAGIALACVTVAVPMRLDGGGVPTAWAVQAAVLAWIGFRTRAVPFRGIALGLFVFAIARLLETDFVVRTVLFNARFVAALVAVVSAGVAVRCAARHATDIGPNERPWWTVLAVLANVVVIWALTLEVQVYFRSASTGTGLARGGLAESLAISVLWMFYAAALLAAGVRTSRAAIRWQGLALLGVAAVKVFVVDLSYLTGFYRIASSIALGVILLAVSFLYQRRGGAERPAEP